MEEIVVGILMLLSFAMGAFVRVPVNPFKKKDHDVVIPIVEPSAKSTEQSEEREAEEERERRRREQVQALWNYSESDGIKKDE